MYVLYIACAHERPSPAYYTVRNVCTFVFKQISNRASYRNAYTRTYTYVHTYLYVHRRFSMRCGAWSGKSHVVKPYVVCDAFFATHARPSRAQSRARSLAHIRVIYTNRRADCFIVRRESAALCRMSVCVCVAPAAECYAYTIYVFCMYISICLYIMKCAGAWVCLCCSYVFGMFALSLCASVLVVVTSCERICEFHTRASRRNENPNQPTNQIQHRTKRTIHKTEKEHRTLNGCLNLNSY